MSTTDYSEELKATASKLVANGKGILAADESTGTIGKRLSSIKVENNLENRVIYRKSLFETVGLNQYISGTFFYNKTSRNAVLTKLLKDQSIILGIKVDKGTKVMPFSADKVLSTHGLDGLDERCQEYYNLGCRFAKWRAVCKIVNGNISCQSVKETAYTLARYAAICQDNGLVPIVEPELLMDGNHNLEACKRWTSIILSETFSALKLQNVIFEGMLMKFNMVLQGNGCKDKKSIKKNAQATVDVIREQLPTACPGVVFLSGGQSEEAATVHLNEINKLGPHPWALSFSFGRALQQSALKAWMGKSENITKLQDALMARAKANSEAALGKYKGGAAGSTDSLFEEGYVY